MKIIRSPKEMQRCMQMLRKKGLSIGFVPTMGALHEGHGRLIHEAARDNDRVVVSIFVNPLQFGRNEDYGRYPRDLKKDASFCKRMKVDYIFAPAVQALYPPGFRTSVNVEGLGDVLCGFFRPGHFRGVTTIVAKLFNIVGADTAYFGQKDAQQAVIIQRMVRDLDLPVKVRVVPIVREPDGLALSSRNAYLSPLERRDAVVLSQSLRKARELVKGGVRDPLRIKHVVERMVQATSTASVEYVALVDRQTLEPVSRITAGTLLALAVRVGRTRLIDNTVLGLR